MTSNNLITHINQYIQLSKAEEDIVLQNFSISDLPKKEILLHAERRCDKLFFVEKGCLQLYFIDHLGNPKTSQFAIENWWLTDFLSFQNQGPSQFFVETVERSTIYTISYTKYNEFLERLPAMERYFRCIYETAYGAALMRLKFISSLSKEEMFLLFRQNFPDFVQRVPQYLLASFLGLTPEYLSEIKKKPFS